MRNLKLIELLKAFEKKEIKEFEKFVASPFFNKGRNYLPLLKEIIRFYPAFDNEKMTKQYIYKRLYCGNKYSEKTMKNMLSALLSLSEKYLVHSKIQDKNGYYLILAKQMQIKNMHSLSEKAYLKNMQLISKGKLEPQHFENQYDHWSSITYHYQEAGEINKNIEALSSEYSSFIYYVISAFSLIAEKTYVYKFTSNTQFDWELLKKFSGNFDEVIRHLRKNKYEISEIIELYHSIIKMFLNEYDEKTYFKIKEIFGNNIDKLSKVQRYRLFGTLHNLISKLSTIDNEKYLKERFAILKVMVEYEFPELGSNEHININLAISIIKTALNLKEYAWLREFIEIYMHKVPSKYRRSVYNYTYANLHFADKNFQQSQEFLKKVKMDIFSFRYDTKLLLLKIYYELKYTEEAHSLIDTFKHFVTLNKSLSDDKRITHSNFIKFYSILLKLDESGNAAQIKKLRTELLTGVQVRSKDWLLEKADELLGKQTTRTK
jgi:hypothetical protein